MKKLRIQCNESLALGTFIVIVTYKDKQMKETTEKLTKTVERMVNLMLKDIK